MDCVSALGSDFFCYLSHFIRSVPSALVEHLYGAQPSMYICPSSLVKLWIKLIHVVICPLATYLTEKQMLNKLLTPQNLFVLLSSNPFI